MRCIAGSVGFLIYNTAIIYIPIGIFKIIMNMGLFMVAILSWLWLKEKLTLFEVIAMFVAFGGVILTSRGKESQETSFTEATLDDKYFTGITIAIIGSMLASVT